MSPCRDAPSVIEADPSIAYAVSDIGGREEMEDEYVLEIESISPLHVLGAVFDGHGGSQVARLASRRFPSLFRSSLDMGPERAFRSTYASLQREAEVLQGGAVAATFYVRGSDVTVANAGDAHIVAISRARAQQLTVDHRLTNPEERERVLREGAEIQGPYLCLPDGSGIMPTRALGDHPFAKVGVLAEPAVSSHRLQSGFLVAACDGLWDVMEPDEVLATIAPFRTAKAAAERLAHEALRTRHSGDNVTILVVHI